VTGSVHTVALLEVEQHPGLVQLVSKIEATLIGGTAWSDLFSATFPPGSVTGAPKISALEIIGELEPEPRSFYCGAFGWIDVDNQTAQLAVAIRTFWFDGGELKFGTGAGITWNSDAHAEWEETELKARNLTNLAAKVSTTP
jgi:para-aminobenzoate synthetase component I